MKYNNSPSFVPHPFISKRSLYQWSSFFIGLQKHKGKYYKVYAGSKVAFVYLLQLLLSDNKLDTFTNGEMHGLPQHVAAKKIQDNPFNFKVRVRKGSYICGYHVDVL